VKQLDEAVLGEDGIMVKLAEAEARMAQAIKSRCRVEARLEKMQVCYLRRTNGRGRKSTCILPRE
jgi:hypothetical protein